MSHTYRVHFLGCKTNQSDAMSYAGLLQRAGWREAEPDQTPALTIVQTCTVTMSADAQGRQMARKLKRENPGTRILMTGCYAQRAEQDLQSIPEIDYVIGNLNPRKYELLSEIAQRDVVVDYPDFPMPAEMARTRPYIKIQEGCDAKCSYCIIPSVRGRSRSLPPDEIVRRVEHFRDRGYLEMILTGISMGGYGKDLTPKSSLTDLIARIDSIPGNFKIRLSSVEPEEIDDSFIDVFASSRRFQPHLHLPLQSASDRVLKKMRRQYLFARYRNIVDALTERLPEINLGTDILVGFPFEDQEAFFETFRYVESTPFSYCHVFPYSSRPGTAAEYYKPAASKNEVTRRAALLRSLAAQKHLHYRRKFLGRALDALVLTGTRYALTDNYIRVQLADSAVPDGKISVRIESIEPDKTLARVI